MTQDELRVLIRNCDARPIRVCVTDGASYHVQPPDFAIVSTDSVLFASGPDHDFGAPYVIVPLKEIRRVELLESKGQTA